MSTLLRLVALMKKAPGPTYATWNPADKSSNITLSGGNLVAAMNTTPSMVRSTVGKSSGKWYWEVVITVSTFGPLIGVSNATAGLSSYPGSDANGWGFYGNTGNKFTGGVGSAYGSTFATGDVIGIALDMIAGTVIFYINNVSQGTAFTGLTGTLFAAVGQSGGGTTPTATANFGATALTYTPPSGYNAGLY